MCLVWPHPCPLKLVSSIRAFSKSNVSLPLVTAGIWFCISGTREELKLSQNPQGPVGLVCDLFQRWIEGREENKNICMLFLFFLLTTTHFGTKLGGVGVFWFSLQILLPFTFLRGKGTEREREKTREREQTASRAYTVFPEYSLLIWVNGENISPLVSAFKVYF